MNDKRHEQIDQIFLKARELQGVERENFLEEACAEDPDLRAEVESLLARDEQLPPTEPRLRLDPVTIELPSNLAPRFEIRERIGEGSFGQVFIAYQKGLDRLVALKLIPIADISDSTVMDRITREGVSLGKLQHSNVLTVFDSGLTEDFYFLITELAQSSLLEHLPLIDRSNVLLCVDWARQVVQGLAIAHGAGILHRDVKPANVLLQGSEGKLVLKLADFGLASLAERPQAMLEGPAGDSDAVTLTQRISSKQADGYIVGSPAYMSPETWAGQPATVGTDIFATGVLLYELFAGRRPYVGRDINELRTTITNDPPPDLRETNRHVPPRLVRLITKMISKERDNRPHDCASILSELDEILNPLRLYSSGTPRITDSDLPEGWLEAEGQPVANLGRYLLKQRIHQFGLTDQYEGWDRVLGDRVLLQVVRVLPGDKDHYQHVVRNVLQEARVMARCRHPSIARVRDVLEIGEYICTSFYWAEGTLLSALLDTAASKPGAPRTTFYDCHQNYIDLLIRLADTLSFLHGQSPAIIIGALSPSRIVVDRKWNPILVSFELALETAEDAGYMPIGSIRGIPAYSSPEHLRGDWPSVGPPSDVFSLGVLLYEMLTGVHPLQALPKASLARWDETLDAYVHAPPTPPSVIAGWWSQPRVRWRVPRRRLRALELICLKAIEAEPAARFSSAAEFGDELRHRLP